MIKIIVLIGVLQNVLELVSELHNFSFSFLLVVVKLSLRLEIAVIIIGQALVVYVHVLIYFAQEV